MFNIGDRVTAICRPVNGLSGVIIGINGNWDAIFPYLVSFDGLTEGDNGAPQEWLTEGHIMPEGDHSCLWCYGSILQLKEQNKIDS